MDSGGPGARARLVRSLAIMSEYHWMFLRHLHAAVDTRFGQRGHWREVLAGIAQGFDTGTAVECDTVECDAAGSGPWRITWTHPAQLGRPVPALALAERDPLEAIFSIRGPAYSSPGISQFDCTYCPLADVWAQQGSEGLKLGYLFDMELHRGLIETYHPGAVVRWDALKTRGDAMCRFRFSIPELVTPQEAPLLEPARDRQRRAGPT
jgi:hypothetical protein